VHVLDIGGEARGLSAGARASPCGARSDLDIDADARALDAPAPAFDHQSTTVSVFGSVEKTSWPSAVTATRSSMRAPERPGT